MQLLLKNSKKLACFFVILFSSKSEIIVLAPFGKPHRNPIKITIELCLLIGNILFNIIPSLFEIVFIICVFNINSVKSANKKREGKTCLLWRRIIYE